MKRGSDLFHLHGDHLGSTSLTTAGSVVEASRAYFRSAARRALRRALDNVCFCERLWRSVKYENNYLQQYDSVRQLQAGLSDYFDFYNHERPHQSLNYRTPAEER